MSDYFHSHDEHELEIICLLISLCNHNYLLLRPIFADISSGNNHQNPIFLSKAKFVMSVWMYLNKLWAF